ncbi:MAG: DUF983 domain-containing protein [Fulvivirga sp.]|uniref:DUF983 domain-containing protein n=1 Tax=Fulvivirga sp. TaxID=1931237 RepID=UPI0032ED16D6
MGPFKAALSGKCPQCREGDIFESSALVLSKFHKMHANCPKCSLKYEREPGFFIGAMYVNYAFSVAIIVAVGIALSVFEIYNLHTFVLTVVGLILLLLPFLFRYSRILFLYWFGGVNYKPSLKNHS